MYTTPLLQRSHMPMSVQMSATDVANTFHVCSGTKVHFQRTT
jgi:hypothetical protein